MKLQILQEDLEKALITASRFTSAKAQLPILGNILLSAQKTKLVVSSTNLETSSSINLGAKIEEEGSIGIPSKVLTELIGNLSKETISLESSKEQLKVVTSNFSSTVLGMDPSDFPSVPSSFDKKEAIVLDSKDFTEALSQVLFATSTDETRPVLTGVLLVVDKKELTLVATDGFRLSVKKLELPSSQGKAVKIILPKAILNELSKSSGEDVELSFSFNEKEKQSVFGVGGTVYSSRLIEGNFPDYGKIIPKAPPVKVFVDKEDFLRGVKLASVFARESANVLKLKITKDKISISAESGQSGSQETKIESRMEGLESGKVELEIAFNYRYLEDFIHSVKGEEIVMELSSSTAAGIFRDSKDSNYLHLIMPVKV